MSDPRGYVVHVNSGFDYDLYVGRENKRYGLQESKFANPYKIGQRISSEPPYDNLTREQVLTWYSLYVLPHISQDEGFEEEVIALRGKVLACWCAPKNKALTLDDPEICHAQVLLRLAQELGGLHG